MTLQTTKVTLPSELVQETDSLVGVKERNAFIAECARNALRNHQILSSFAKEEPIWKDEDHPDLAALGTEAWVRSMRQENEERFASLLNKE